MPETQTTSPVSASNATQTATTIPAVSQPVAPVVTTPVTPVTPVENMGERASEQFGKLLDSNKRLFEANEELRRELQAKREASQQFSPIQQPPIQAQQPVQVDVNPSDFIKVDPITGERYVDDVLLKARIEELSTRASRAETAVQKYIDTSEQREIERQNREAFNAYPELNPADPNHNTLFHNQTRAVIYDSVINPQDYGGKALSFKDAADYVKKTQKDLSGSQPAGVVPAATTPQDVQPGVQQQTNQQVAQQLKEQASVNVQGQQQTERQTQADPEELQRLRVQTRLGSAEALAARLANVDHVIKKKDTS